MRYLGFVLSVFLIAFAPPAVRAQDPSCPLAPRLSIGMRGHVAFTDGKPLNARENAGYDGAIIGTLPEGAAFDVLDGALCADGLYWWFIRVAPESWSPESPSNNGSWIAEGADGEYFVAAGNASLSIDLRDLPPVVEDGDCGTLPSRVDDSRRFLEVVPWLDLTTARGTLATNVWVEAEGAPICHGGGLWWEVSWGFNGLLPETLDGKYVLQPFVYDPSAVTPLTVDVPLTPPVLTDYALPLPAVTPDGRLRAAAPLPWRWNRRNDPIRLALPAAYAGDFPALPIDLNTVHFAAEAGLDSTQLALLAQNGFVVVRGDGLQMEDVYRIGWYANEGRGIFVTTDALLHALFTVRENALPYLENDPFFGAQSAETAALLALDPADLAAALGSDAAYAFATSDAAAIARWREWVNRTAGVGGAWLHLLQPLATRNPALLPPFMQTDAWRYKDLNTLTGSLTEYRHVPGPYTEQGIYGRSGEHFEPPLTSYGVVEPDPLVFARIAIIAKQLSESLQRSPLFPSDSATHAADVAASAELLAGLAADMAEIARKEIAGQPISLYEYTRLQADFADILAEIRYLIEQWNIDAPPQMGLAAGGYATGSADFIYVVANGPFGLHLTRGAVYSTYRLDGAALTDEEWRARLDSGDLPPLAPWTAAYRAGE